MQKICCSVPILTLNSGRYLRRCLESVKCFDDVFLVDGNSTDDTLEIAREYNVPVYKQFDSDEKNIAIKNFTEARERALSFSKYDWVLILDSDEFLEDGLAEEIDLLFKNGLGIFNVIRIQKRINIGNRNILFSFSYPNYQYRMFNVKSGVGFKKGKIVHEQVRVPEGVSSVFVKKCFYAETPPTYLDCVKKDAFQLGLMKQSTLANKGSFRSRSHSFKIGVVYFLRALKILLKSLMVYLAHGYKQSLPIGQVMRHVRVHLIMSGWRLQQCLFGNINLAIKEEKKQGKSV